jgi:hypothetical protein
VTPPPPNPMPAPTTPPSMMPMAGDAGVPITVPRSDGGAGAPRDAAMPSPIRDAGPGVTRGGDGGMR